MLAANFAKLEKEIAAVQTAGADWLHLDIMDGHFVPNISFGPCVIEKIKPITNLPLDTHLMISPYEPFLESFAKAGSDLITIHAEASPHLHKGIEAIKKLGKKAGVAINPATPISAIENVIDLVDLILIMTVNPGFGGQTYIYECGEKIKQARSLIGQRQIFLEVDGGVAKNTCDHAIKNGANVLVAGSAIFNANNYSQAIKDIRGEK